MQFASVLSLNGKTDLLVNFKKNDRDAAFAANSFLIFSRETKVLPKEILALYADRCYTIPMTNPHIRSRSPLLVCS